MNKLLQDNAQKTNLLRFVVKLSQNSEAGLSITEVLMAMLVTALVLSIVTPIFLVATSTRVLNYRVQQAMDLAKGEIDRVQVNLNRGIIPSTGTCTSTEQSTGKDTTYDRQIPPIVTNFEAANPPNKLATVTSGASLFATEAITSGDEAVEVDIDQDGRSDFLIQTFRSGTQKACLNNGQLAFLEMGVRVYAIAAKSHLTDNTLASGANADQVVSMVFGKGLQEMNTKPLAVARTEIIRSDATVSWEEYKTYKQQSSSSP